MFSCKPSVVQAGWGGSGARAVQGLFYAGIYTILTDFIYLCSPPGICFYTTWRCTKFKYEFGLFSETGSILTLTCKFGFRWIPFSEPCWQPNSPFPYLAVRANSVKTVTHALLVKMLHEMGSCVGPNQQRHLNPAASLTCFS